MIFECRKTDTYFINSKYERKINKSGVLFVVDVANTVLTNKFQ